MVRRAPGASDARVYDVSGRRPTPISANLSIGSKSAAAKKRARRKLELQNTDTDLIQDFAFPTVSQRIKVSRDGRHIFASGTYPPQIHVYDTDELSLKFKRHVNNDIVDFQILEDDWKKFALLTADRYIDLHSPFGSHFKTRVPRHGRDLMLHRGTCDLYVCGEGPDVWRLNLEQGRFMAPLPTVCGRNGGNNVCGISPINSLLAFGSETALLDIWDPRMAGHTKTPAATHDVASALAAYSGSSAPANFEISSVRFDESDGVTLAVGTSIGQSVLFDLRSATPVLVRDQGNGLPIRSIRMHDDGKHCISADPRSIKVWDKTSGVNMVAIEPDADLNHLCVVGSSGVMCTAVETQRVKTFYIPALGPAPRWCAFLDNFTEELEDNKRGGEGLRSGAPEEEEEVYENYKFVSHDELEGLGLGDLIGTDMLKAYMHGYFVHQKLYRRALEVSEPFAYAKYRKERAREKLEAERENRIAKGKTTNGRKKVKVNQKVVDSLQEKDKKNKKSTETRRSVLEDERFSAMFSNVDYAVEEEAERFQFLHPSGMGSKHKHQSDDDSDEEYLERSEGMVDREDRKDVQDGLMSSSEDDSGDGDDGKRDVDGTDENPTDGIRRVKQMQNLASRGRGGGKAAPRTADGRTRGATSGVGNKLREEVALGQRVGMTESKRRFITSE